MYLKINIVRNHLFSKYLPRFTSISDVTFATVSFIHTVVKKTILKEYLAVICA